MIPPFSNLLIELLKGTALVSVMGMGDLTFSAKLVRLALKESAEIYTYVLVIYFVIAFLLTRIMRRLERNLKAGLGQGPTRRPSRFALSSLGRGTAGTTGMSAPATAGTTTAAGARAGAGGDS
jgi:polar amino acid transport system permease protein